MWIRAATILFIFSVGLSACSLPASIDLGDKGSPSTTPSVASPTITPTIIEIPFTPQPALEETEQTPAVEQVQAATATSQPIEAKSEDLPALPPYRLQPGSPVAVANFIRPESGCNWMGIGGQAFNLSGQPVSTLVVEVGGSLAGSDVFHLELTGNEPNLGPGGFLVTLSDRAIASTSSLWIILYDLAGQPLTSKIYFSTYQDCSRNFIMINFVEVIPNFQPRVTLPLIRK